jgi:hypothetical protein
MISDQELLEVIQGLYEKTSKENLKWQYELSGASASYFTPLKRKVSDSYWARMPNSVIELHYGSPPAEPDFITFTIARDLAGEILATRKVYEGDIGWEPLSNLYSLIKRRDLGWDDVYRSMREFLGKPTAPAGSQKGP